MSILTFEVLESFSLKRDGHVTTCSPGQRISLSQEKAQRMLEHVGEKVRLIQDEPSETVTEPAAPNARPVWWESMTGDMRGPATPLFLAKTGTVAKERFWVIVEFEGQTWWIQDERLRAAPQRSKRVQQKRS